MNRKLLNLAAIGAVAVMLTAFGGQSAKAGLFDAFGIFDDVGNSNLELTGFLESSDGCCKRVSCCKPVKCCAPKPCCKPVKCCAPAPTCCAPRPTCCKPVSRCCAPKPSCGAAAPTAPKNAEDAPAPPKETSTKKEA